MPLPQSRPDAFLRELTNAGLAEAEARRYVDLAREFESARGRPPTNADDVRVFARERAMGSLPTEVAIRRAVGAYLVFLQPATQLDVSAVIRTVIGFEAENAVGAVSRTLEGEGRAGRILTRMFGLLRREEVKRWIPAVATALVVLIAFLENPIYRLYAPKEPKVAYPTEQLQPPPTDEAMQQAWRDAGTAVSLSRSLKHAWRERDLPRRATLRDLLAPLPETRRKELEPFERRFFLDEDAWTRSVDAGRAPGEMLFTAGDGACIVVTPETTAAVESGVVAMSGGSR